MVHFPFAPRGSVSGRHTGRNVLTGPSVLPEKIPFSRATSAYRRIQSRRAFSHASNEGAAARISHFEFGMPCRWIVRLDIFKPALRPKHPYTLGGGRRGEGEEGERGEDDAGVAGGFHVESPRVPVGGDRVDRGEDRLLGGDPSEVGSPGRARLGERSSPPRFHPGPAARRPTATADPAGRA